MDKPTQIPTINNTTPTPKNDSYIVVGIAMTNAMIDI